MATVFSVRASASKGSFSARLLSKNPIALRVEIPAEPVKGEANRVLVSCLEKMLGCPVGIVAGKASRRKTLAADCTPEQLLAKLKE